MKTKKNLNYIPNHKFTAKIYLSKIVNMTSIVTNRGQQENIDLITVINFAEQAMTTLPKYGEQLKSQLDFNPTQQAT